MNTLDIILSSRNNGNIISAQTLNYFVYIQEKSIICTNIAQLVTSTYMRQI